MIEGKENKFYSKVNERFNGKYEVVGVLGQGGMGKVYLAKNVKLGNLWAIKQISKNEDNKIDVLAESNAMKIINHPTIVRIFDIDEDEENVYIVEDYVDGISLEEELKKVKKFEEEKVIGWAKQICDALDYLHNLKPNPIIYRDMKPANIMITKDGRIKIIDFGIAREYKEESTADTTYIGTRGFAAPEQYGSAQTDARTDIYSLGATLYSLVTGLSPNEPPYEIQPIRLVDSELSKGLEYIISKCTKLNPEERYQSIKELSDDLININKLNSKSEGKKARKSNGEAENIVEISNINYALITVFGFGNKGQSLISNIIAENFAYRGYNTTLINLDDYNSSNYYYDIDENYDNKIEELITSEDYNKIFDEAYLPMENLKVITGNKDKKVELTKNVFNNILNSVRGKSDIIVVDISSRDEDVLNSSIMQSTVNIAIMNNNPFYSEMGISKISDMINNDVLLPEKTMVIINEFSDKQSISYKKVKDRLDEVGQEFNEIVNIKYMPVLNDFILSGESFYSDNMDEDIKEDIDKLMDALKSKKPEAKPFAHKKLKDMKRTFEMILGNKIMVILFIILLVILFGLFIGNPF